MMMGPRDVPALLRVAGLCKRFGRNDVLVDMDFELRAGEIHALLGENGAGKSTMIAAITGVVSADKGNIFLRERDIVGQSPYRVRQAGISAVFQEFSLAPDLTVDENLFLGQEHATFGYLSHGMMRERSRVVLAELGFDCSVDRLV